MAKFSRLAGSTSQSVTIFIQDSSSTIGAGLSGLTYTSTGLLCYYTFTGANTTAVSVSLATLALVTTAFSEGGFIEIDATHQKGLYRLDLKNTSLAASKGNLVTYYLYGATNMAPVVFDIELTAVDNQSTGFGLVDVSANTVQLAGQTVTAAAGVTFPTSVASPTNITAGTITTVTTVTNQLTAAAIATGVWTDTTAGDFTTAVSIGKSIMNGVSLGTGLTVNALTNAPTSGDFTATMKTSIGTAVAASAVASVTAAVTVGGFSAGQDSALRRGTAQAGGASTITLDSGASATNSLYNGCSVAVLSGTGTGQDRIITGYVGATKVATVTPAWTTQPDNTSLFALLPAEVDVETWLLTAVTAASAGIPDVNTKNIGGQTVTAGAGVTFPASVASPTNITAGTITTVTNLTNAPTSGDFTSTMKTSIGTAVAASAVASVTGNVGGNVTGSVGSVVGNTDQTGDVYGLLTGANTELTSVPSSTATLVNMWKWIYLLSRNKITQTATTTLARNNADGATVGTSTVSDDGTTFIRGLFS